MTWNSPLPNKIIPQIHPDKIKKSWISNACNYDIEIIIKIREITLEHIKVFALKFGNYAVNLSLDSLNFLIANKSPYLWPLSHIIMQQCSLMLPKKKSEGKTF